MRILKVEPGKAPYEKEIENNLRSVQAEVKGTPGPDEQPAAVLAGDSEDSR